MTERRVLVAAIAAWGICATATVAGCAHESGGRSGSAHSSVGRAPEVRTLTRRSPEEKEGGGRASAGGSRGSDRLPPVEELESRARRRETTGDYPYHDRPREVRGSVDCPEIERIEYDGEVIAYNRPVEINPRFRRRLVRFERIVREVAVEVYGRPPDRIVQRGGYVCRTVGGEGEKLSEHSFGHAIDVAGFDFEAVSGGTERALPDARARGSFEVRLGDHWDADGGFAARHRRFLRRLAVQLQVRGPFSMLLGPAYPNHDEVFHFDFGPEFFFRLDRRP